MSSSSPSGAGRPHARPIPLWPKAFRRMKARCCPSRWPPTLTCRSPIRRPFWSDRSTEQFPVHIKPATGSDGEVGPLLKRPTSSVSAVVGAELDHALLVAELSRDHVEDLQPRPHLIRRRQRFRPGARMPGPPEIVEISDGVCAVSRPHQLFGGRCLPLPRVKRSAAPAELLATATWTVI